MSPNGWLVGVGGWGFLEQSTTQPSTNQQTNKWIFQKSHSLLISKPRLYSQKFSEQRSSPHSTSPNLQMDELEKWQWKINIDEFIFTFKPNKYCPKHPPSHFFDPYGCFNNQNTYPKQKGNWTNKPNTLQKVAPKKKNTSSATRQFDEHLQSSAAMDSSLRLISRGAFNTKRGKTTWAMEKGTLVVYRVYIGGMKSCPVIIRELYMG